jgi:hypothetical protein
MASPKTIQSTIAFTDPQNNVVALGVLLLDLSQPSLVTSGGGQVAPRRVAVTLTAGGVIPGSTTIWANDQLTPSGTTYHARLYDSNLNLIADFGQWNIAGASPIDLSQITPVSTSAVSNPAPVLIAPAADQHITGTFNLTTPKLNSVIYVDGTQYTTLASAYAALPSTGGTVVVPPGYTETFTANLVVNKQDSGFLAMGAVTITMASFQVTVSAGTSGVFFKGINGAGGFGTNKGWRFLYTGTATAFVLGDASGTGNTHILFENMSVDLSGAGASARAFDLLYVFASEFNAIRPVGGQSQIGFNLDGTGGFTGDNIFRNIHSNGLFTTFKFAVQANNNVLINVVCANAGAAAVGAKVLDFENGNGNIVIGADIENANNSSTAVFFANNALVWGNYVSCYLGGNTTDFSFGAASLNNTCYVTGGISPSSDPVVSDSGTNNSVWNPRTFKIDVSSNVTLGSVTELTANGATWKQGQNSENLTLSTSATTTDTAGNLLPANSIIESVVARVTTTITTATDWKLGDATTAGRFSTANSTLVAGTTQVGTVQADQTGAPGPRQVAAAKVRVTTTGTPGAGAIRITVFYRQFVPPTS